MRPILAEVGVESQVVANKPRGVKVLHGAPTRADEIRELKRRLVTLEQQARDESDRALLAAIVVSVGGAVFYGCDLIAHARIDGDLRETIGDLRPRQLGKRLARLANRDLDGLTLRRCDGRDERGCMWFVQIHD